MENFKNNNIETLEKENQVMSPEQQQKVESMSMETETLLKGLPMEEEVKKMPEEKQKLYFSKTKVLLTVLGVAGLATFAKNYGNLDIDVPETMLASKQAILEGAGVLTATMSTILLGFRNIYEKYAQKGKEQFA